MNPLVQLVANTAMNNMPVPQNNVLMQAFKAMMSGQTPQEFLKTIPQLNGMDLNNIQGTAKQLCQSRGIDYAQAKNLISNLFLVARCIVRVVERRRRRAR